MRRKGEEEKEGVRQSEVKKGGVRTREEGLVEVRWIKEE